MPIATPEVYAEMIDRAKAGSFAYPAVNVTSSQTLTAALQLRSVGLRPPTTRYTPSRDIATRTGRPAIRAAAAAST